VVPAGRALLALVAEHYEEVLTFYGRDLGHRVARKHLGWFMDEAGTPADLRRAVLTQPSPEAVQRLLPEALMPLESEAA
jgi:tRNA-dihydrouridine synthase